MEAHSETHCRGFLQISYHEEQDYQPVHHTLMHSILEMQQMGAFRWTSARLPKNFFHGTVTLGKGGMSLLGLSKKSLRIICMS